MTPTYGLELPFERIAINQGALCVERTAYRRRSTLRKQNCEHIGIGNKPIVKTMKFRCQSRTCGAEQVRLYNAHTGDEATMFIVGDRLPDGREIT